MGENDSRSTRSVTSGHWVFLLFYPLFKTDPLLLRNHQSIFFLKIRYGFKLQVPNILIHTCSVTYPTGLIFLFNSDHLFISKKFTILYCRLLRSLCRYQVEGNPVKRVYTDFYTLVNLESFWCIKKKKVFIIKNVYYLTYTLQKKKKKSL